MAETILHRETQSLVVVETAALAEILEIQVETMFLAIIVDLVRQIRELQEQGGEAATLIQEEGFLEIEGELAETVFLEINKPNKVHHF